MQIICKLLEKSGKTIVNVRNNFTVCLETFNTPNNLNPSFMSDIFQLRSTIRPPIDK